MEKTFTNTDYPCNLVPDSSINKNKKNTKLSRIAEDNRQEKELKIN